MESASAAPGRRHADAPDAAAVSTDATARLRDATSDADAATVSDATTTDATNADATDATIPDAANAADAYATDAANATHAHAADAAVSNATDAANADATNAASDAHDESGRTTRRRHGQRCSNESWYRQQVQHVESDGSQTGR